MYHGGMVCRPVKPAVGGFVGSNPLAAGFPAFYEKEIP